MYRQLRLSTCLIKRLHQQARRSFTTSEGHRPCIVHKRSLGILHDPFLGLTERSKLADNINSRNFPPSNLSKDTRSIEEEAERKLGWVLKLIFAGTATFVGYQVYPYMGDNLMQQSVSLLQVKDPLFKRMGASRLSRFARDDERRLKIMEVGGAEHLLNMLGDAKEDRTRKEALKALVAISPSDEAVGYLHRAGAISIIRSIPDSSLPDAEVEKYKLSLMKRFEDLKYDS